MVQPPYGVIWKRIRAGKVIPFLGAGASFVGRPSGVGWNPEQSAFLPSGAELSNYLAAETSFPGETQTDKDNLAKVASYYVDINGRPVLRDRLREVLNHDFPCGPLHRFLAEVPAHQVIVVTNYDSLVEKAFQAAGKPYDLVVYPADRKDIAGAVLWWPHGASEPIIKAPNELDIDLAKTTVIYKMHGTLDPKDAEGDNFVITEEDYVEFLSRMTAHTAVPSLFSEHFRERSFLFLGYSLSDWNLRVILKNLNRLLSPARGRRDEDPLPSWAIQYHPSELERTLWKNRNVSIFDMTVDDFVAKLRDLQRG